MILVVEMKGNFTFDMFSHYRAVYDITKCDFIVAIF